MSLPEIREFWLIFAILGVFCLAGMLLYNRFFSEDTSVANRRAWRIMLVMYGLLTIGGIYFFFQSLFVADQIQWKTFVQSVIMLGLGGGGITLSLKRREEHA